MERRNRIAQQLSRATDLPDEPIPGLSLVEIAGDRRVLVENHKGVIQYCDSSIRIRVKFGEVCISGTKMTLARMTKGQLVISGCIDSVSLLRGC